jgi:hypothetical protein
MSNLHLTYICKNRPVFLNLFDYAEHFWQAKMLAEPLLVNKNVCGTPVEANIFMEPLNYQKVCTTG